MDIECRRSSPEQFTLLVDFMERHGDLTRPQQGPKGRLRSDQLWLQLTVLLNSCCGVSKTPEKWKKVWVDWKTKTKRKALLIRHHAGGTGDDSSKKIILTALEERVLAVMGLSAVVGQGSENISESFCEGKFSPPPPTSPLCVTPPLPSPDPPQTPPRSRTSTPSKCSSTRRHQVLRRRRIRSPFERATNEYFAVELERLRFEEKRDQRLHEREVERERLLHEREVERLRLESQRLEVEQSRNDILRQLLAEIAQNLSQLIPPRQQ